MFFDFSLAIILLLLLLFHSLRFVRALFLFNSTSSPQPGSVVVASFHFAQAKSYTVWFGLVYRLLLALAMKRASLTTNLPIANAESSFDTPWHTSMYNTFGAENGSGHSYTMHIPVQEWTDDARAYGEHRRACHTPHASYTNE